MRQPCASGKRGSIKKSSSAGEIRASYLARAAALLHYPIRDSLLLSPGEYLDMIALLTPKCREEANPWQLEQ